MGDCCELCYENCAELVKRSSFLLCPTCAQGWDYQASLTPAERRAEEAAIARYVDNPL